MFLLEENEYGDFVLSDALTVGPFTVSASIHQTVVGPLLTITHSVERGSKRTIVIPQIDVDSLARILHPESPPVSFMNVLLYYKIRWENKVLIIHQRTTDLSLACLIVHEKLTRKVIRMIREASDVMTRL